MLKVRVPKPRLQDFFSFERQLIISLGITISAIAYLCASHATNPLFKDWCINISAGGFSISFTAAIFDYLAKREVEQSRKYIHRLVDNELREICNRLLIQISELSGFKGSLNMRWGGKSSIREAMNAIANERHKLIENRVIYMDDLLETIGYISNKVNVAKIDSYNDAIDNELIKIEKVLDLYGYALKSDQLKLVCALRDELKGATISAIRSSPSIKKVNLSGVELTSQRIFRVIRNDYFITKGELSASKFKKLPPPQEFRLW